MTDKPFSGPELADLFEEAVRLDEIATWTKEPDEESDEPRKRARAMYLEARRRLMDRMQPTSNGTI